jgi:hypothetical protein
MGILTGTGIFGPALAYLLGGLFSKIYVTLERTFINTFIINIGFNSIKDWSSTSRRLQKS